jgi:hypothetical protein
LFVDNIYPNVKELGLFCITKHDSLIVRREDFEVVRSIVVEGFNYFGFEATIDSDDIEIVGQVDCEPASNLLPVVEEPTQEDIITPLFELKEKPDETLYGEIEIEEQDLSEQWHIDGKPLTDEMRDENDKLMEEFFKRI